MVSFLRHALLVLAVLTGIRTFAQQNTELYSRVKIILDSKDHTIKDAALPVQKLEVPR